MPMVGAAGNKVQRHRNCDPCPDKPGHRLQCLDHQVVWNAAHMRRVLKTYADYYNNDRTHLGLAKDAPNPRTVEASGAIVSRAILGELHHRYRRVLRE